MNNENNDTLLPLAVFLDDFELDLTEFSPLYTKYYSRGISSWPVAAEGSKHKARGSVLLYWTWVGSLTLVKSYESSSPWRRRQMLMLRIVTLHR